MDRHWSTVCALIVAFCALVHFGTVSFAARTAHTLREKPGVCPRRRLVFGHCMKSCSYDGDCPNNNKCCSTGCGRDCMAPVIAKPGFCPQRRMCFGHCSESCSYDSDCPDNEKCCSNGCGHVCMAPAVD
uniref:WAP four-disulfide core domain 2 n=1 Tax=Amphilophus citrinellus TaxID=61819 RepID=A0A3Q0SS02_AMPCI